MEGEAGGHGPATAMNHGAGDSLPADTSSAIAFLDPVMGRVGSCMLGAPARYHSRFMGFR